MIQINKREKRLLIILLVIVGIIFSYYFIIDPLVVFKKNAGQSIEKNLEKISRLDQIYSDYKDVLAEKNQLNLDAETKGIASVVDEAATSLNIITNKVYLTDNPGAVKDGIQLVTTNVKFEGVSIRNMIEFIYRLETSGAPLKIKNLTITSGIKGKNRYDSVITILSLSKR
jgi:flagellar basal body-associated protein FliL